MCFWKKNYYDDELWESGVLFKPRERELSVYWVPMRRKTEYNVISEIKAKIGKDNSVGLKYDPQLPQYIEESGYSLTKLKIGSFILRSLSFSTDISVAAFLEENMNS